MEKKGTLRQKRRPKGDPNPQKGPLGDPGPLKETQLGIVSTHLMEKKIQTLKKAPGLKRALRKA